ncbi:MAG TPA: DNA recombination protein RmuC [Candidatus Nanoarchaeia archaeon]|nr:DNA recombination protein RmuC [Candidatus Nanoarchaeia archaeon]
MSTGAVIGIVALFAVMNAGIIWFIVRGRKETPKDDSQSMTMLMQHINDLNRTIDMKMTEARREMGESSRQVHDSMKTQFGESARLIRDVTQGLTKLDETNKQVISFADQLQSLQDILKNPKQRGILGEYYLETLLKNVLAPSQYQMQYSFKNGEIVDAAVFVKDKVIPVDSKFSLENYNRMVGTTDPAEKTRLEKLFVNDLKIRITETAKYIRPEEGTMEFAFMFIPHEAIYYDLLINKIGAISEDTENLIQRAAGKYKVIIVSPTSFLAYLQTVLQGLKAMQIEEKTKEIQKNVSNLMNHLKSYEEYYGKIGTSLSTVVNHYNNGSKEFKKIDKDILKITGSNIGMETLAINRPEVGEDE